MTDPPTDVSTIPDRESFLRDAIPGTIVPVVRELPLGGLAPLDLYAAVRAGGYGVILESGKGGRYSYVAASPARVWRSYQGHCELDGKVLQGDPFELLAREFEGMRVASNPALRNFSGGAIGYFAYDMARYIERLPATAIDDLNLPESYFLFFDSFYEFDQADDILRLVALCRVNDDPPADQFDRVVSTLRSMELAVERELHPGLNDVSSAGNVAGAGEDSANDESSLPEASLTPEEFAGIVRRAREYITAGDIFQVNLSVRFRQSFRPDPFRLYLRLRQVNPAPYMSYFDLPEMAIVSASPELLLKVQGGVLSTRPIAGTRPRGASDEEDLANARELIENEKERAEHLMLVDLERNDIGRVARYGSVRVDEFMAIEGYSHVMHIVSNVRGELAPGRATFDAIRACFPGGTITGAPKVRSMEIIEELEGLRRGLYTGSIGWLGFNGDAELNIAIRTIVVHEGTAYMQAGAGIVADSVPELEYLESVRKAEAALVAVRTVNQTYNR